MKTDQPVPSDSNIRYLSTKIVAAKQEFSASEFWNKFTLATVTGLLFAGVFALVIMPLLADRYINIQYLSTMEMIQNAEKQMTNFAAEIVAIPILLFAIFVTVLMVNTIPWLIYAAFIYWFRKNILAIPEQNLFSFTVSKVVKILDVPALIIGILVLIDMLLQKFYGYGFFSFFISIERFSDNLVLITQIIQIDYFCVNLIMAGYDLLVYISIIPPSQGSVLSSAKKEILNAWEKPSLLESEEKIIETEEIFLRDEELDDEEESVEEDSEINEDSEESGEDNEPEHETESEAESDEKDNSASSSDIQSEIELNPPEVETK